MEPVEERRQGWGGAGTARTCGRDGAAHCDHARSKMQETHASTLSRVSVWRMRLLIGRRAQDRPGGADWPARISLQPAAAYGRRGKKINASTKRLTIHGPRPGQAIPRNEAIDANERIESGASPWAGRGRWEGQSVPPGERWEPGIPGQNKRRQTGIMGRLPVSPQKYPAVQGSPGFDRVRQGQGRGQASSTNTQLPELSTQRRPVQSVFRNPRGAMHATGSPGIGIRT